MTFRKVPEVFLAICDNCGEEKELTLTVSLPTYWALIEITHHEDWSGGKSTKHYCPNCYKNMNITFGKQNDE